MTRPSNNAYLSRRKRAAAEAKWDLLEKMLPAVGARNNQGGGGVLEKYRKRITLAKVSIQQKDSE